MSLVNNEKHEIISMLKIYWKHLEAKGHNVYAIMLKGSQNYNLDDDESDIDANAIIIPTLSDLRKNQSYKYEFSTGEVTCHNIYSFAEIVAKGNPQWVEAINTDYRLGGDLSMFQHYKVNPSALKGMVMEKVKAFSHPYPSQKEEVERLGFAPKQLHHIIRLYDILEKNVSVYSYTDEEKQHMLDIKRGRFPSTKEEAEQLRDEYVAKIAKIYEERKLSYQPQKVNYEQLDEIVMKEFCNTNIKNLD